MNSNVNGTKAGATQTCRASNLQMSVYSEAIGFVEIMGLTWGCLTTAVHTPVGNFPSPTYYGISYFILRRVLCCILAKGHLNEVFMLLKVLIV